jgi:uncharacterized LabA/DUF88 family protein
MRTILFIDGRNFLSKLGSILNPKGDQQTDYSIYDFKGLVDKVLNGIVIEEKLFYLGKLLKHSETLKKSEELIEEQRKLKTHLDQQGFTVILAGRVRGHIERCPKGHDILTFKEKGVDVKIATDMISFACDQQLKTAIIGSSDSDLQPAVKELEKRRVERIYLGFENSPNKGLTFTTNRTILVRNSEVLEFAGKTLV